MYFKTIGMGTRITADLTLVWFFPRVDSRMHLELTGSKARKTAGFTLQWFLSYCVNSVTSKITFPRKRQIAYFTREWLFTGVNSVVNLEMIRTGTRITTDCTLVRFHHCIIATTLIRIAHC